MNNDFDSQKLISVLFNFLSKKTAFKHVCELEKKKLKSVTTIVNFKLLELCQLCLNLYRIRFS